MDETMPKKQQQVMLPLVQHDLRIFDPRTIRDFSTILFVGGRHTGITFTFMSNAPSI